MSVVKRNEPPMEGTNIYPYEQTECIECHEPLFDDGRPTSGGYHCGDYPIFLCSRCAQHSDHHILGYLIGDALIAGDYPNRPEKWPYIVDKILEKLRSSIFRAMLIQIDPMKYPWAKKQ